MQYDAAHSGLSRLQDVMLLLAAMAWMLPAAATWAAEPAPAPVMPYSLYVAPQGSNNFSGRLPAVNAEKTDGPLATLTAARDKVRAMKMSGQLPPLVTIYLRGGRYELENTLVFTPEDSAPVLYSSYPGEEAVLDGGRQIRGFQPTQINGQEAWVAEIPEVKSGRWSFRELFVDGQRRPRARLPKSGAFTLTAIPPEYQLFKSKQGFISNVFVGPPDLVRNWQNLGDVEVVVLHFWNEDRSPIAAVDPEKNLIRMARVPTHPLIEDTKRPLARFYVENVLEALSEPGEWYLDRPTGRLYYLPLPGEDPAKTPVIAPRLTQLMRLEGKPEEQRYVEFLRFQNLTFVHSDWYQPDCPATDKSHPELNLTGWGQSASLLSGAIQLTRSRSCAIEDCRIAHTGWYGIDIADGCSGIRVVGNELFDLGAGGVKLGGAKADQPLLRRTGNNRITDNHIHDGGRVFHAGCGILAMHSFGNALSHNHIHDLYYSGISCGWVWGYGESVSRDNRIEKNHIHDLGHKLLNDLGGIYTLGTQLGTVIRGNLIHDIQCFSYGAWAIYPDEGSSHLIVEDNVCYNTASTLYGQHYGRENLVRNNIFAFGTEGQASLGKAEEHNAFTFQRNIVVASVLCRVHRQRGGPQVPERPEPLLGPCRPADAGQGPPLGEPGL